MLSLICSLRLTMMLAVILIGACATPSIAGSNNGEAGPVVAFDVIPSSLTTKAESVVTGANSLPALGVVDDVRTGRVGDVVTEIGPAPYTLPLISRKQVATPMATPASSPVALCPTPEADSTPVHSDAHLELLVSITAEDWVGGLYRGSGEWYGRPWVAVYGAESEYPGASFMFDLDTAPETDVVLTLVGLDDELEAKADIRVEINGLEIYTGPSPFPNWDGAGTGENAAWTEAECLIPANYLIEGANEVSVSNLEPYANYGEPPWILLSDAHLKGSP